MNEHTPGPWETSDHPHQKSRGGWPAPSRWHYVQHNYEYPPYEGDLDDEWGIYPPIGECGPVALVSGEANGRLIAAAPDLLAACEAAEAEMNAVGATSNETLERLRAAIAKATGGQS